MKYYQTHHISYRWTQRILAIRYPDSLIVIVYRPEASKTRRMRWCVVIRAVLVLQGSRFLQLPHPYVILQRFFRNHHLLLLHIVLELLVKTVQSMDELVFTGMSHPTLWTMMRRMRILLVVHELILLVGVVVIVVLTTNRVIIRVDLNVFKTLTAQWELMLAHAWRTL